MNKVIVMVIIEAIMIAAIIQPIFMLVWGDAEPVHAAGWSIKVSHIVVKIWSG